MSFAAAFLMIAQASTAPAASVAPARREQIVASATASARILAPTIIRFASSEVEQVEGAAKPQHNTDSDGRGWIEFS